MVYVISNSGHPLMPTGRHGKARRLLKESKAKVVKRCPFTIQLLYGTGSEVQKVNLGIDAGSKTIGASVTTETRVLYESEVTLRNDIVDLLSSRRELRKARRNRKTRYRKPRFDNRNRGEKWLAPSIRNKIEIHLKVVSDLHKILPVSEITVELAAFDLQKLKADWQGIARPQGEDYNHGEQFGFWNAREYVLFRDGHECQCCKGKSKDKILNVHHIESRKVGGDAPNNLITLCETCHTRYHKGTMKLPKSIKRGMKFKDACFMGVMRWSFYNTLKETYPNVKLTYGYITKNTRIRNNLPKTHYVDARCISGNPNAKPLGFYFLQKKVRCHNRQIHKLTILKGGYRKRNQAEYIVKGYRLFDKVKFRGIECFVFGRRTSGSFDVRKLDGTKVSPCAGYKKLKLLEKRKNLLIERRSA